MRFRTADIRSHGWRPLQTLQIPDWGGCSTEYWPVPVGDGWWQLVPIWQPDQTVNRAAVDKLDDVEVGAR
jgi:hypothetical protein